MSNLISCIECGHSLSENAVSCPKCQAKRFKGVECKACNGILKGSEAISILIENNSKRIEGTSFDGEVRNFEDNFDYRDKWVEKLYPYNEKFKWVDDYEKRDQMYRETHVDGKEVYTFHRECFDSITNLKEEEGEVIVVECISCSSKIRFESYVSSIDYQDCKICGERNITANVIAERQRRKTNCFNCSLPVLKSAGIEIFKFDSYLASTGYVHQVCFNEKISNKSLENKEKTIKQQEDRLKDQEKKLEKQRLSQQKENEKKQQELYHQTKEKIIASLTTTEILEKLCEPLVLFVTTGIAIIFFTNKGWLYALIGTPFACIIVGCTPLAGEILFLLSIIHWVLLSVGRIEHHMLITGGLFIGILFRSYLLDELR